MAYHRTPKTTNERRQVCGQVTDGDYTKARRKHKKGIPNSYDDLAVASFGDKCWKRIRRTKYKRIKLL